MIVWRTENDKMKIQGYTPPPLTQIQCSLGQERTGVLMLFHSLTKLHQILESSIATGLAYCGGQVFCSRVRFGSGDDLTESSSDP